MMSSDLLFRFRALVRRRMMERELNEELQFHLEHQIGKYENSGMSREAAIRQARLELGGLASLSFSAESGSMACLPLESRGERRRSEFVWHSEPIRFGYARWSSGKEWRSSCSA